MLTREEIMKELDEIGTKRFYLAMIDRWTSRCYDLDREYNNREMELKKMLENL